MRKALLLALLLPAWVCSGQNLAQNPGFETGTTSGWFAFGSPTISAQSTNVHSGSYAGLVQNRTATWHGIAQSLLGVLQPGQTCDVSVWVRMPSGSSQTVQMTVKQVDGGGTTYSAVASGSVSASSWTQLSGQYTLSVSGTLTELTLYLEVPTSATAAYYVDDLSVTASNPPADDGTGQATVNWNDVRQVIDGFGASSAWRGSWSSALAEMFFSTNSGTGRAQDGTTYPYTGIGLSLLRTRIAPGGTTVEQSIMQMAQARGARVWSSPWSPATQFKSNTNVNGGSFVGNAANYQAYANQLAGYVLNMKNQYGISLYALSIQNEPDADVTTYESCNWTAQQIHDFIPYLADALTASNVAATKILLPESQNWTDPQGLRLTALNDPAVAARVGIIANHNYVADNSAGDQTIPAAMDTGGKALWETEVAKLSGSDSSMSDALYWAGRVHLFLTAAGANAWHYWWLCGYGASNEGLCDTNDAPAKRFYTLGNFSRFVRPGFHRIGISNQAGPLLVSAYKNLTNASFVIVAINSTSSNITQTFNLNGFAMNSLVTPWLTSDSASLAAQTAFAVSGSVFTNIIPAMSVVTLTGQAVTNSPPAFTPIADQAINPGVSLVLTNLAHDPDVPPQSLAFSLLAAPINAALNTTSGVFTWRPLLGQADTSNNIVVRVTDNGTPPLSATNRFSIKVNPLAPTTVNLVQPAGATVRLIVQGAVGPDYTLLTSTNLAAWQPLYTTNPAAAPFILVDTNAAGPARFYRLQLGP